ncbi:MAG: hypothetical protein K0U19_07060 [Proteobacteria bacterium]|nr:hypothetical protein [Pseudomonadota bacterium]
MSRIKEALDIVKRAKALGDYDSNVIGMAAEIIAEEDFGMIKSPAGKKYIDGYIGNYSIQVKSFSSGRVLKYKGAAFCRIPERKCDKLIFILIYSNLEEYEILYNDNASTVGKRVKIKGKPYRDIRLDSLKSQDEINQILQKCQCT